MALNKHLVSLFKWQQAIEVWQARQNNGVSVFQFSLFFSSSFLA